MSRSLNTIWRNFAGDQSAEELADPDLRKYAADLDQHLPRLRDTAQDRQWQEHYEVALEVCRTSRRIRMHLAGLEADDPFARTHLLNKLEAALNEIKSDAETVGIQYSCKSLQGIRDNVKRRIDCIADKSDDVVYS
jgi:hypothetical protein